MNRRAKSEDIGTKLRRVKEDLLKAEQERQDKILTELVFGTEEHPHRLHTIDGVTYAIRQPKLPSLDDDFFQPWRKSCL